MAKCEYCQSRDGNRKLMYFELNGKVVEDSEIRYRHGRYELCAGGGLDVKINFCPMCGRKLNLGYVPRR